MTQQQTYRKKPVEVQAVQWFTNGNHPDDQLGEWLDDPISGNPYQRLESAIVRFYRHPDVPGTDECKCGATFDVHGWIDTLEGGHTVCPGDFIITGVQGERYPCKPDIFEATYEPVEVSK